ncbi:MAG: helix-turn-helix domain-containing protein [Myxococcota bacterium]|nr:helix-turn-helix domain-containing protein [Myxococcota bacterium]
MPSEAEHIAPPNAGRIIAIGSGKGGVGTSMIATNIAVFLAQIGKQVCLVDGNLTDAGLHTWLGLQQPELTIADVLNHRIEFIEYALCPTRVSGLSLLAGAGDLLCGLNMSDDDCDRLLDQFRDMETDYVIIDLPSGMHAFNLHLFGSADVPIAIAVATPDAIEATYRLIKAAYLKKLLRHSLADGPTRELLYSLGERAGRPPTAREIVASVEDIDSPLAEEAARLASTFHPQLIVNQIKVKADEGLGEAMVAATARWIGIVARVLGPIEWDDNVWLSLRRGIPLLIDFPQSRACRGLERIVRRLLSQDLSDLHAPAIIPPSVEDLNLYELLEIYPSASEEEVRRGLKQIREYFGIDGLAVRGACSEEERADYQRRAQSAQEILIDKSRRREYDRTAFPNGFPSPKKRFPDGRTGIKGRVKSPHDSLPKVELRDDQMVNGAFLGEIRRERGIELEDISNRAKISISYLRAIEEEQFDELPEPVYIRGFVTEYARYLKINPTRAVDDFMATYDAHMKRPTK